MFCSLAVLNVYDPFDRGMFGSATWLNVGPIIYTWLDKAREVMDTDDTYTLGGWVRSWLGDGRDILHFALTCKLFRNFMFPICPICRRMWRFQGWFVDAWFKSIWSKVRITRANVCQECDKRHPCYDNPHASMYEIREIAAWVTACKRCGDMYSDRWAHDGLTCSKPLPRDGSSSPTSSDSSDHYNLRSYLDLAERLSRQR
jgi:hypothetical protein